MVVRELIARLGFEVNKSSLNTASSSVDSVKSKLAETGSVGESAGIRASSGISMLTSAANVAKGVLVGLGIAAAEALHEAVSGSIEASDEMQNMYGRLAIVTKSEQERNDIERALYNTAQNSRQALAETGDLYFKVAKSADELGVSQQNVLDITETVTKALTVGGAGVAQSQATILQLGQALSSGVLQGDELRSLDENAFDLMQAVAEYFGTTIGNLKKMGSQGELTADKVAQAILFAKKKIDAQFEKMPLTVGQAMTMAGNAYRQGILEFERNTGLFSGIAHTIVNAVKGIQNNLEWMSKVMGGSKNVVRAFAIAIGSLGAALVAINFSAIAKAIKAFAVANAAAFGEFMLIAAAIAIVALAIQDLYVWINGGDSLLGRWLGSWDDFKTKIGSKFGDFFKPLIDSWNEIFQLFQRIWQQLKSSFSQMQPLISQLSDQFSSMWIVVSPILSLIGKFFIYIIGGAIQFVITVVMWLIEQFLEFMTTGGFVANAIVTAFKGMAKIIGDIVKFVTDLMSGNFSDALGDIGRMFYDLGDTAIGVFKSIAAALASYVLDKITVAKNAIFDFLGWSTDKTNSAVNDARRYNQYLNINQNFNGNTDAINAGYMQKSATDMTATLGFGLMYQGG